MAFSHSNAVNASGILFNDIGRDQILNSNQTVINISFSGSGQALQNILSTPIVPRTFPEDVLFSADQLWLAVSIVDLAVGLIVDL